MTGWRDRGRRLRRRWPSVRSGQPRDGGRAIVEFVFLGVLVLVPLVYLVLVVARVQAGAYAVTTASREAGRAFTTSATEAEAPARAHAAAGLAFEEFDFADAGQLDIVCDASPCLHADGHVTVTASLQVSLPLVPAFLEGALPVSVPMSATHVAPVDRFRAP